MLSPLWPVVIGQAQSASPSDLRDWAAVASAGIAAIAAFLSFLAIRQARNERREDRQPNLLIQPLRARDGKMTYSVTNAGGGLARQARYLFVHDGFHATGALDTGFLRPDDEVLVETSIEVPEGAQTRGVVMALDPYGEAYAWNEEGRRMRLRKRITRKPDYVSPVEALERFAGTVSLGTETAAKLAWRRGGPST
jgi:hypothetical protein